MRSLVGIDARMLDKRVQMLGPGLYLITRRNRLDRSGSVQSRINVASARNLETSEALDDSKSGNDLFGYFSRSFSQFAGQLKRNRTSILAELDLRGLLDHNVLDFDLVQFTQRRAQPLLKLLLLSQIHVGNRR